MSGDPLAYFGLAADADARAVKRAYAVRLKQTRPDDDPAGFQQLHDAYQRALAWCAHRAAVDGASVPEVTLADAEAEDADWRARSPAHRPLSLDGAPVGETTMEALPPDDEPRPAAEAVQDLDALVQEVARRAVDDAPLALAHWLRQQPLLWSLAVKPMVGDALLHVVQQRASPLSPEAFDTLAGFFEWHQLGNGIDPLFLRRLRHALYLSWMLRVPSPRVLGLYLRQSADGDFTDARADQARRQLTHPHSRLRALLAALRPMWPTRLHRALNALEATPGRPLVAPLDPDQARFWFDAGDRTRLSVSRLQVGAVRCLAFAVLLFGIFFAGMQGIYAQGWAMRLSNSLSMSLPISAWVTAAWLAWVLGTALFRWAMAPESDPVRWPWLRLALGPMLFGASALAMSFTGGDTAASWLAALGTIVCLMRLLYRWPGVGKLPVWVWPLILTGMHLAAVVPSQIRWVLLAGAAAWIADCARHWRQLRALATGHA